MVTGPKPIPVADRFWSKVQKSGPNDCWLWIASKNNKGYGQLGTGSRSDGTKARRFAHRISYEMHHGPIPTGVDVCHSCDTPLCVNPRHLFLGTRADNMRDCAKKNRTRKPTASQCRNGHPYTDENTGYRVIRGKYGRFCRECARSSQRSYYRKTRNLALNQEGLL